MVKFLNFATSAGANRGYITYLAVTNQLNKIILDGTESRSSLGSVNYNIEYAIDGDVNTRYGSSGKSVGDYFQLSFPAAIFITGYSLQYINTVDSTTCYLKTFEFSGSNDNIEFDLLDNPQDSLILSDNKPHIFHINETKQNIYKHFKITNKGLNGCGQNIIHISEIDIFGKVYQFNEHLTCQQHMKYHFACFFLFLCI